MTEVIIQGFLGRDPVVRETEKGGKFLAFTVCSSDFFGGKQKEQWFDCVWFDYTDKMAEYLKKGSCVNVVGGLDADLEIAQDGKAYIRRKVITHFVTFGTSNRSKDDANQQGAAQENTVTGTTSSKQETKTTKTPPTDEEINVGVTKAKKFSAEDDNNSDLPF